MGTKEYKLDNDGRVKRTYGFRPEVYGLLEQISNREVRSEVGELTHLIVERARSLGLFLPGQVGEEGG